MKTETFELEKLKVELLPELQGWKEKQKAIVKGNPFVKIEDTKTYEEAKKHRTALVSARTDVQKQEKTIASKIKDFRNRVAEASKELIAITQPHEDKQQDEVKRYEAEKEAERVEKQRIERERKDAIQREINDFYNGWKQTIQSFEFSELEGGKGALEIAIEELSEKDFEEFEMDFSEKATLLKSQLSEREQYLTEKEEARKEAERLAAERAAFEKEQAEAKAKAEKEEAARKAQEEKERAAREAEAEKLRKDREELEAEKQRLAKEEAERQAKIEAERKAKEDAERKIQEEKAEAERKKAEEKRLKALQPDKEKAEEFIDALSFSIEPPKIKDEAIEQLLKDFIGHAHDLQKNFKRALTEIK